MIAAALNALAGLVLAVNGQVYDGGGATVDYVDITASDVTVTNLRIRGTQPGVNGVTVWGSRNVLRRITVERSGASGVYFAAGDGNVLEDSTIRDPMTRPGVDSWGVYSSAPGAVTVRRNTVYGSGFSNYAPVGSALVEDNRFIVPADYRTDCAGNALRDGPCQCAEFGVALKTGNAVIRGNFISGYRKSDPVCGGSGSPGEGIAVPGCTAASPCPTDNVVVEANRVTDSRFGIYLGPASSNVVVRYNRVCDSDYGISDGYGNPSTILGNELIGNGTDINLYGSRTGTVAGNVVAPAGCLAGEDVGAVLAAGSHAESGSTFTVAGSGDNIWGSADDFHFVSQLLRGDGEIVARLDSFAATDAYAKAALMFRDTSAPDSRFAALLIAPGPGGAFHYRTTTGGSAAPGNSFAAAGIPRWMRLVRQGNVFTGYFSDDGASWVARGSVTLSLPSAVLAGLAVTSHADGTLATAVFGNVAVRPATAVRPDSDGDGMPDGLDNCSAVANANQLDADGDGYGNLCDADLNNSGLTTSADSNLLRSVLNLPATASPLAAAADMNGSGAVTTADLALLRARLNSAPGPSGLHPPP